MRPKPSVSGNPQSVSWVLTADRPARRKKARLFRPVAPFDKDYAKAVRKAFDRETAQPVPPAALKTVRDVIAAYPVHSEIKFFNGEGIATGTTHRRHVRVVGVRHIGKEANRWEEQQFVGLDQDATPDYGLLPTDTAQRGEALKRAQQLHGVRPLARQGRVPIKAATAAIKAPASSSATVVDKLLRAAHQLAETAVATDSVRANVLGWAMAKASVEGHAAFSRRAGLDSKNLRKMLAGKRVAGAKVLSKIERLIELEREKP